MTMDGRTVDIKAVHRLTADSMAMDSITLDSMDRTTVERLDSGTFR